MQRINRTLASKACYTSKKNVQRCPKSNHLSKAKIAGVVPVGRFPPLTNIPPQFWNAANTSPIGENMSVIPPKGSPMPAMPGLVCPRSSSSMSYRSRRRGSENTACASATSLNPFLSRTCRHNGGMRVSVRSSGNYIGGNNLP